MLGLKGCPSCPHILQLYLISQFCPEKRWGAERHFRQIGFVYARVVVFLLYLDGHCWNRPAEIPGQRCEIRSGTGQSLHSSSPGVLWEQPNSHSMGLETKHTGGPLENLQKTKEILSRDEIYSTTHKICNSYPSGILFDRDWSVNLIRLLSLGWSRQAKGWRLFIMNNHTNGWTNRGQVH